MKPLYRNLLAISLLGLTTLASRVSADHAAPPPPLGATPEATTGRKGVDQTLALIREASLALLKEGNVRYASGEARHPNQGEDRRSQAVAEGQKPFATILACSDSRSPVEVLFDRGVGELFVVRVAGNVADESQVATIEYGVEHLHTPLLVVLGHSGCGAVTAACKGGELPGHLHVLVDRIKPAVAKARTLTEQPDRLVATAIEANVWQQIEEVLASSSLVREKVKEGALQIVGGVYDLEKGTVGWLGQHPTQEALISKVEAAEKAASLRKSRQAHSGVDLDDAQEPDQETASKVEPAEVRTPAARPAPSPLPPASFSTSLLPSREVKARTQAKPAKIAEPADHGQGHEQEPADHAEPQPHGGHEHP